MTHAERRIVIVGASAAGLRCAARLARLRPAWEITVVEGRPVFSYAACGLPYLLSGDLETADPLRRGADGSLRDAAYFAAVKGVRVLAGWKAHAVDPAGRVLLIRRGDEEKSLPWEDLVLATGARPRRLPGQPEDPRVMSVHTLEDGVRLRQSLERGQTQRAVVVGAGLLGCEMAEAFRSLWGAEVTLVEQASWPLPGLLDRECGDLVAGVLRRHGVQLLTGTTVDSIVPGDGGVTVEVEGRSHPADVVVVAVGVQPEADLAASAGIRLGASGAVAVDDRLATSVDRIWAAGDCVEVRHAVTGQWLHLPLGSLANRQGRTLANVLGGLDDRFPPVTGAAAVKVFDWNVAAAGCTGRVAAGAGLPAESVWVCGYDRSNYWPEAKELFLHLLYGPDSGQVLGVQVVGDGEAVKKVDVAAQFIARGATVGELAHLEHAYAPPYAPAVDLLAVAAWVAENRRAGITATPPQCPKEGVAVLDVRSDGERDARPFPSPGLTGIPLGDLRDRVGSLPAGPWLVVCERGGRSAEAVRLLRSRGIESVYLGGGWRWLELTGLEE